MLGEKMANQYSSVEEAQKDKDFRFYIDNTLGYMKGWEYAKAHKPGNIKQFIALYQDEYINTYHAEIGRPNLPDEELDAIVLKKILQKIGIINKRNE